MKGDQIFDALGRRWTIRLGNAAQCTVEEQYGKGFFAVVSDALPQIDPATLVDPESMVRAMGQLRLSVLRDLAWHGLQRHHPDVTLEDVSDITDDLGHAKFGEIIGGAIRAAQGQEVADEGAKGKPAPTRRTRAQKRTGSRS